MLATEQDDAKRQVIDRLLAEEQAKLAVLNPPPVYTIASLAKAA
jgi:hypothetical protein